MLALVISSRLKPVPVVAMPVVRGTAIDAVYATGTVEAEDRVQVKAKTSGSLAEVLVKEGDRVKKGDLVARIDNPQLTFELKRGKVDLSAASAQGGTVAPQLEALKAQAQAISADLALARQDAARLEKLGASGAVAAADTDRAKACPLGRRSPQARWKGARARGEAGSRRRTSTRRMHCSDRMPDTTTTESCSPSTR